MGIKKLQTFFIFLFLFSAVLFGQGNQVEDDKKKLIEEILTLYKTKGDEEVRNFVKKNKDNISRNFIVELAESGVTERNEKWLKISKTIAEEKKDERSLADVYFHTGDFLRLIANYNEANYYFEKALRIYIKINDLVGQGEVYHRKGEIYHIIKDHSETDEMYDKALLFFKKAQSFIGQGNVYHSKGNLYLTTGDYSEALEMYDKALFFFKKERGVLGLGGVFFRKGEFYLRIGNNLKASEMYEKALNLYKKVEDLQGQGNVYLGMGRIYSFSEDSSKALEMYDKALVFFKKVGEPIGQGNVYRSKGAIYLRTDDNSKALEMLDLALSFFEKAGEPIGQGNVYWSKGEIYFEIGDSSKAFECYDKALVFFKKVRDPQGQGNVYSRMGRIYFFAGDNSKALEMYHKAQAFYEKVRDLISLGNVYFFKGNIYMMMGNFKKVLEMYGKALSSFDEAGELQGKGNVHTIMGLIYFFIGNNSRALQMYEKAFTLYKTIGATASESLILYLKTMILTKLGKKDETLALFESSISKVERIRGRTPLSELKIPLLAKFYFLYKEAILFMLENKYDERGYKYFEFMRARSFLEQLSEGLVKLDKGISPEFKQKRDTLISKLSVINRNIAETSGKKHEKKLTELTEQLRKIEIQLDEVKLKIRSRNPLYASVQYPEPVLLNDLQENILKYDELLLEYFVSDKNVYVFMIGQNEFKVIKLKMREKDTRRMVNRYLLAIKEKKIELRAKYAAELYTHLFEPVEEMIKRKKNIIIVPDGELAKIPFESFVIGEKKSGKPVYLLEKYRIKYIQSASVLATLRKHYRKVGKTNHFIGFGDPVYDYENFKQGKPERGVPDPDKGNEIKEIHRGKYDREGGMFNRLPGSGQEVEAIAELFNKQNQKSVVYLRDKANEENAKSLDMKQFDYIHFSCHGVLGDGFQSLVLSQIPKAKEDGYLTLNEIMNCDYHAKLVVLSACQTGSGKMERAEGVTGLTRAVMYAGTPAVVASLWNVQDIATKELMVKFYENILEKGMNKEEALRQAKLEMIKSRKYSSPYFWSAFVMYGE